VIFWSRTLFWTTTQWVLISYLTRKEYFGLSLYIPSHNGGSTSNTNPIKCKIVIYTSKIALERIVNGTALFCLQLHFAPYYGSCLKLLAEALYSDIICKYWFWESESWIMLLRIFWRISMTNIVIQQAKFIRVWIQYNISWNWKPDDLLLGRALNYNKVAARYITWLDRTTV
jgi:hypothetical protein